MISTGFHWIKISIETKKAEGFKVQLIAGCSFPIGVSGGGNKGGGEGVIKGRRTPGVGGGGGGDMAAAEGGTSTGGGVS